MSVEGLVAQRNGTYFIQIHHQQSVEGPKRTCLDASHPWQTGVGWNAEIVEWHGLSKGRKTLFLFLFPSSPLAMGHYAFETV